MGVMLMRYGVTQHDHRGTGSDWVKRLFATNFICAADFVKTCMMFHFHLTSLLHMQHSYNDQLMVVFEMSDRVEVWYIAVMRACKLITHPTGLSLFILVVIIFGIYCANAGRKLYKRV